MGKVLLCRRAGMVNPGHVALGGTKVRANASKHRAMSDKRMKQKEDQLQGEADELPESAFREGRLEKIRQFMAAPEAEAQAAAARVAEGGKDHPEVPDDDALHNSTDAEPASCRGRVARTACGLIRLRRTGR